MIVLHSCSELLNHSSRPDLLLHVVAPQLLKSDHIYPLELGLLSPECHGSSPVLVEPGCDAV